MDFLIALPLKMGIHRHIGPDHQSMHSHLLLNSELFS